MKSLDTIKMEQKEKLTAFLNAAKGDDQELAAKAMAEYFEAMQNSIRAEYEARDAGQDAQILASRGIRQLTKDERTYYQAFIEAAKSSNPKQALSNLDVVLPKTVINEVFDDIGENHPLLSKIDFQNTTAITEWIVNKGTKQLAAWGKLCDDIVKELSGDLAVVNVTMSKLSAWIPVCKSMLILGPEWLDRYVRGILYDALAYGLEEGIVNGTGVDQPIGLTRDLAAARVDGDPYAEKAAEAVTTLDIATVGALLAKLAKTPEGRTRRVGEVVLVVNPVDNYQKVAPATNILTVNGEYKNIMPFPISIVESEQVAEGKAILFRTQGYFMGIGTAAQGTIEYSDEYKFLEDDRVYLIKMLGTGFPKDNNCSLVLDISGLKPVLPQVETVTAAGV